MIQYRLTSYNTCTIFFHVKLTMLYLRNELNVYLSYTSIIWVEAVYAL